jgi:phosphonate transport system ATP-binding protein
MVGNSADSAIVRLDNVGVTYPGGVTALRATSIAFRTSECVVLLGRSGAGKSTLLRTLNHLVPPTTGHIVSREFGVLGPRHSLRQHRRRTASIFQHHQLIERQNALDNVLTGARLPRHATQLVSATACRARTRDGGKHSAGFVRPKAHRCRQ